MFQQRHFSLLVEARWSLRARSCRRLTGDCLSLEVLSVWPNSHCGASPPRQSGACWPGCSCQTGPHCWLRARAGPHCWLRAHGWDPSLSCLVSSPVLCSLLLETPHFASSFHCRISFAWERALLGAPALPGWRAWRQPGSQDCSQGEFEREAHASSLGLFCLSRWWLLRCPSVFSLFDSQNFYNQNYAEWVFQRISFSSRQTSVQIRIPDYKQIQFLRTSPKGPLTRSCSKNNLLLQRIMSLSKIFQTSGSNPLIFLLIKSAVIYLKIMNINHKIKKVSWFENWSLKSYSLKSPLILHFNR